MSAPNSGVVELVNGLIADAAAQRASDIHINPTDNGVCVVFRVDGVLRETQRLPQMLAPNIVARLKVMAGLLTYRSDIPQEGAIPARASGVDSDIRVATLPTITGERVVLRLMANTGRFMRLVDLGHPPERLERLRGILSAPQGLLLVVGPAGSGKTTTLAAMLAHIAAERPGVSLISVEDPVEIRIPGVTQVEVQVARGMTYPVILRSLMRQDPQVIMIGEIRDADVARIVADAALTGHLVLSSMHAGSTAEAIVRLRDMGLAPYQITSVLHGVLAQRLLRRAATGANEGFAGRIAIGSLIELSPPLSRAILSDANREAIEVAQHADESLRAGAERLVATGLTTTEEVRRCLGDI